MFFFSGETATAVKVKEEMTGSQSAALLRLPVTKDAYISTLQKSLVQNYLTSLKSCIR